MTASVNTTFVRAVNNFLEATPFDREDAGYSINLKAEDWVPIYAFLRAVINPASAPDPDELTAEEIRSNAVDDLLRHCDTLEQAHEALETGLARFEENGRDGVMLPS